MARGEYDSMNIKIGAVNTDASPSKRNGRVRNDAHLARDLGARIGNGGLDVITLSEVSNRDTFHATIEEAEIVHRCKITGIVDKFGGGDNIVQLWDTSVYEASNGYTHSTRGRYMGVPLTHIETGELHMHISVHLPNTKNSDRAEAKKLLEKFVDATIDKSDCDAVFVHGDFNYSHSVLKGWFAHNMQFAVNRDDITTTAAQNQLDNVIGQEDKCHFHSLKLDRRAPFSHHPLTVNVEIPL